MIAFKLNDKYSTFLSFSCLSKVKIILMIYAIFQFALVHYFTKLGAGEYYLEELEETICAKEVKKLAMYANMCRNTKGMNGITPVIGATKIDNNEITNNFCKDTSIIDKSENERLISKTNNKILSVSQYE